MERYISDPLHAFSVLGNWDEFKTHQEGKAYIFPEQNHIYVYSGDLANRIKDNVSRVYDTEDGLTFVCKANRNYTVDRMFSCSIDDVKKETIPGKQLYDEKALAAMNAATEVFRPTINKDDDFLKKIIKTAILTKNINIKIFEPAMPKRYALTNLKTALNGPTKMTVTNFMTWCDLLHLDFDICTYDRDSDLYPMDRTIVYSSGTNELTANDGTYSMSGVMNEPNLKLRDTVEEVA